MAFTFGFYADPALTTRLPSPLFFVQSNISPAPDKKVIWFGSPDWSAICQASSNPGVDAITVSPVDSASGSGSPQTDIKLALSEAELATAVAGGSVDLSEIVYGGSEGCVEIYVQVTDSTHAVGVKTDLYLTTNGLVQS